jgi:hypothetical protein
MYRMLRSILQKPAPASSENANSNTRRTTSELVSLAKPDSVTMSGD